MSCLSKADTGHYIKIQQASSKTGGVAGEGKVFQVDVVGRAMNTACD